MSAIPATSTAGPDIPIILDRGVITLLVKGLLSILHPAYFHGPLSGQVKTRVPVQTAAYTFVLERLGLPNHHTAFAITQTVQDVMDRARTAARSARDQAGSEAWKQAVIDGIVDRYMGLTTEDYPEGLAPLDMPFWWQKEHLDPKTCLPFTESTTVRIMRVED